MIPTTGSSNWVTQRESSIITYNAVTMSHACRGVSVARGTGTLKRPPNVHVPSPLALGSQNNNKVVAVVTHLGGHFDLYSVIASDCPPTFVHQRQPSAPMRMQQARTRARTTSSSPFNIKHSVYTTPPHRWPDEPAGSSAPTPPIDGSGIMIAAYRGRCDLPPGFPNLGSYLPSTQCNPRAQPAEASP